MMRRWLLSMVILGTAAAVPARAEIPEPPEPHVYLCPTVGLWRWDEKIAEDLPLTDRTAPVWGARAGYSPIQAFAGELVFLTGTNDVRDAGTSRSVRLTQVELSFLVNFRSLVNARIYPFLDIGAGYSRRHIAATTDRENLDPNHLNFHIGGGVKADLSRHLALRANLRDTFFTESQGLSGQADQVTVDAVEISAGLEYRIGWGRVRGPKRLR